jgi:hypothetical protein
LHALQPLQGQALYPEVWAAACSTRLGAHALLGDTPASALADADLALAGSTLPALDALALCRARGAAARAAGDGTTALAMQQRFDSELQRMALSLAAWPEQQAAFKAFWAAPTPA